MVVNTDEVIECGKKLYYDINPNTKMDIPSLFYVRLENIWIKWRKEKENHTTELPFYEYCKSLLKTS